MFSAAVRIGIEPEGLEDEPDLLPAQLDERVLALVRRPLAVEPDPAAGRTVEPADHVQERRLARAGAAVDDGERALRHGEVDVPERVHDRVADGEVPRDPPDDEPRHSPSASLRSAAAAWPGPATRPRGRARARVGRAARARASRRTRAAAGDGRRGRAPPTPPRRSCSPPSSSSARRSVSVLVRPSRIAIVRLTCVETSGSWVKTITVTPSASLIVRSVSKSSSADLAVELPRRLVCQQHLGSVREGDGDRHALLLAA